MKKARSVRSNSVSSEISTEEKAITSNLLIATVLFGVALRTTVSLYDFSGHRKPPMYGDYEAQRHWQEITVNTPIKEWYTNTTNNDLLYWGLDYPPLTAYHSYVLGEVAKKINPSFVKLHKSRGFFSDDHKLFMRSSVLATDLLIYVPAAIAFVKLFQLSTRTQLLGIISFLYYPGLLLIDYGHFQYNNISLGLALAAIVLVLKQRDILGSIFFCLALNYKQMELYHSLPFFYYFFRKCFKTENSWIPFRFTYFMNIAVSVVITFAICWLPWLLSNELLTSVLNRLFPFNRGLFEDKVSNFWCFLNVFFKIRDSYDVDKILYACLGATVCSTLPSLLTLFFYPSKQGFLYAILNSALGFFLFSYQVHEKSILLACLPALCLICSEPQVVFWFLQCATFSMFPLIHKDGLTAAFIALNIIFESLFRIFHFDNKKKSERIVRRLRIFSLLINITLTILYVFGPVPNKYPYLYDLLISANCCIHFMAFMLYFSVRQVINRNEHSFQIKN